MSPSVAQKTNTPLIQKVLLVFHYIALFIQWAWFLAPVIALTYHAIKDITPTQTEITQPTTFAANAPPALAYGIGIIALLLIIAGIIYSILLLPKMAKKTDEAFIQKPVKVVAKSYKKHHVMDEKQAQTLELQLKWWMRYFLSMLPLFGIIFPYTPSGITEKIALTLTIIFAAFTIFWLALYHLVSFLYQKK